jgi:hypothetical protein
MKLRSIYIYIYICTYIYWYVFTYLNSLNHHMTTTHLQHPTELSSAMHSRGDRGQPSVLHCVRSFMPVHACSCVGIWHMSVAPVLGTHLFVVTFVQSPSQSHLSRLKVGYGMGGWVGCVLSEHRVGNPRFFSNTKQRSSLDGWGAKVDKNDVGKGGSTYS